MTALTIALETSDHGRHWLIGATALVILLLLLFAMLAFGKGRDHS
ncbi:MAG TPA: hypothetical protein VF426_00555 [Marmoricola sp.]